MVGKGITYDTGGADIKVTLFIFVELLSYILNISEIQAGGIMAGMSRDKCGAASAAGGFKLI